MPPMNQAVENRFTVFLLSSTYQDLVFLVRHRPGKQKTDLRIRIEQAILFSEDSGVSHSRTLNSRPSGRLLISRLSTSGLFCHSRPSGRLLISRLLCSSLASRLLVSMLPTSGLFCHSWLAGRLPVSGPFCRCPQGQLHSFIEAKSSSLPKGIPSQVVEAGSGLFISLTGGCSIPIFRSCRLFQRNDTGFFFKYPAQHVLADRISAGCVIWK